MNILWIVVDCLRNDALSINGYERPTSVPIDSRLERDFVQFTDACTQSGFTLSVLSSLVTGTYPSRHGAIWWEDRLSEEIPTFSDVISDSSLGRAQAVPAMNFLSGDWGVERAFGEIHGLEDEKAKRDCNQATASEVCNTARKVIGAAEPFTSLLWFFDLHTPWLSEPTFDGDNPKRDRYDSELQYVSGELEELFEYLEDIDAYDDTLVIVTGDHGDVFREHHRLPWNPIAQSLSSIPFVRRPILGDGYLGHLGRPLVEEIVHVPLFVKLPGQDHGGSSVTGQVELIDILPTILDLADVDPPDSIDGESLLPTIETGEGKEYVKAEIGANPANGLYRMARADRYKLLRHRSPRPDAVTENPLLFASRRFLTKREVLLDRFDESEPIRETPHDAREALRSHMDRQFEDSGSDPARSGISEERREELENLGYL